MTSRPLRALAVLVTASLGVVACGDDDDAAGPTTSAGDDGPDSAIDLRDESLQAETVIDSLDEPTSMAFVPDVGLLVTEKASGEVLRVSDDETTAVLDLAVNSFDERGLLGIAVHPEFDEQPFIYLHWTASEQGEGDLGLLGPDTDEPTAVPALGNRVDRFRWTDDGLVFDRNIVQFPSNTLDSDTSGRIRGNHDAGPLAFGPDGKLYVMMGDQNLRGQPQNIASGPPADDEHLAGVILRLNDDGSTPPDNPFSGHASEVGGEVGANLAKVYAYGVRNSFGLAFEPLSGALWQTENGDDSYDEVNVITGGSNSGWVQIMGPPERYDSYRELEVGSEDGIDTPSYGPDQFAPTIEGATQALYALPGSHLTEPVLSWVHPPAVTAIAFVTDDRLGESSRGTVWLGTVLTDSLLRYPLGPDGRSLVLDGPLADRVDDNESKGDLGESEPYVVGTGFGVVSDIDVGPDGSLYVASVGNGAIYRLSADT
jgi:aldose sugar dehydrogenase